MYNMCVMCNVLCQSAQFWVRGPVETMQKLWCAKSCRLCYSGGTEAEKQVSMG